jgi:hypothetical protein
VLGPDRAVLVAGEDEGGVSRVRRPPKGRRSRRCVSRSLRLPVGLAVDVIVQPGKGAYRCVGVHAFGPDVVRPGGPMTSPATAALAPAPATAAAQAATANKRALPISLSLRRFDAACDADDCHRRASLPEVRRGVQRSQLSQFREPARRSRLADTSRPEMAACCVDGKSLTPMSGPSSAASRRTRRGPRVGFLRRPRK